MKKLTKTLVNTLRAVITPKPKPVVTVLKQPITRQPVAEGDVPGHATVTMPPTSATRLSSKARVSRSRRRPETPATPHVLDEALDAVRRVDNYRQQLAQDDPVLQQALRDIEVGFARNAGTIARQLPGM